MASLSTDLTLQDLPLSFQCHWWPPFLSINNEFLWNGLLTYLFFQIFTFHSFPSTHTPWMQHTNNITRNWSQQNQLCPTRDPQTSALQSCMGGPAIGESPCSVNLCEWIFQLLQLQNAVFPMGASQKPTPQPSSLFTQSKNAQYWKKAAETPLLQDVNPSSSIPHFQAKI